MFITNKYYHYYYSIIDRAKSRVLPKDCYVEKHHINPKSLGGNNSKENIVQLTAREHFICHMLLVKMTSSNARYKMAFALNRMLTASPTHKRYAPSSRIYEFAKKEAAIARREMFKGKTQSPESNLKRSIALKGRKQAPRTDEHKKNISISRIGKSSPNKGKSSKLKGLTYEEIFGEEKATQLKQDKSAIFKNRKFSEDTIKLMSSNRKNRKTKGENSNAKPITLDGIYYSCKKSAQEVLGITLYELNKRLKCQN